jgi:hypothetical protein
MFFCDDIRFSERKSFRKFLGRFITLKSLINICWYYSIRNTPDLG